MRAIERGTRIDEHAPKPHCCGDRIGAMDQYEYRERLSRFESHVSAARVHSGILETMMVDDPDSRSVLNTYPGFFVYAKAALHNGMPLETAKALDKDARTASLPNLAEAARESPEFAPGVDIASIERWLRERVAFITDLIRLRNTRLAHFDVPVPEPPAELEYGEFKDVLDVLWMCAVALYRSFHQVAAVSDDRVREARAHTAEITASSSRTAATRSCRRPPEAIAWTTGSWTAGRDQRVGLMNGLSAACRAIFDLC